MVARRENLLTAITVSLFSIAAVWQFQKSLAWGHSNWGMTEWLINYAGGFVRRGLPGEVVYRLATATGIPANYFILAVSLAAFLGLLGFLLLYARVQQPAYLVLSPVVLGLPVYANFIVRKDTFVILLLVACLAILRAPWPRYFKLLLANAVGVVAVLSHEEFLFVGVPVVVLLATQPGSDVAGKVGSLANAALAMSPVIAAFVSTVAFHGDADIAHAVNASLASLWLRINPGRCCMDAPAAAIDALQWTPQRAPSLSAAALRHFSFGIYEPLAWLATAFLCFWFLCHFQRDAGGGDGAALSDRRRLASILVFQLVMISPLFVLGRDFGRWIFLWTASSLAIYALDVDRRFRGPGLIDAAATFLLRSVSRRWSPSPWYLLFFGVPGCCWDVYAFARSTPFGFCLRGLARLLGRFEV